MMIKNLYPGILIVLLITIFSSASLYAQEDDKKSPFTLGADIVSSYVWRGSKVGSGPNIQPAMKFSKGRFTLGAWGSTSFHDFGDVAETDLFTSYTFDPGLSIGLTDYYYFGYPLFRFTTDSASHAFEVNLGYTLKNFSFSANYVLNDASKGGPANRPNGGDMYFELDYTFKQFGVFAGAGNGWNTTYKENGDDVFAVCNIGMKASKKIKISDSYSLSLNGALSVNPDREQLNLVVGISF
jgi:hypothetical protein